MTNYCPAIVRSARYHIDPEPEEPCWNEVESEGAYCAEHQELDEENPWGDDE